MIERHWKGIARSDQSDNYIKHLITETFPKVSSMRGFVKATILKRPVDEGVEFLIVTAWESIEAVKQFSLTGLNNLAKGTYIVLVVQEGIVGVGKVIKE